MKRFLVFAGPLYYPRGGWEDFKGDYDTIESIPLEDLSTHYWYHIVDTKTGQIVKGD